MMRRLMMDWLWSDTVFAIGAILTAVFIGTMSAVFFLAMWRIAFG